jgi:hypothetical protein
MGHTVQSQRQVHDLLLEELRQYGKSLYKEDQNAFNSIMQYSLKRIGSISYTSSFHVWAFILISIMIEQEKKIQELQHANLSHRCLQIQQPNSAMDQGQEPKYQDNQELLNIPIPGNKTEC